MRNADLRDAQRNFFSHMTDILVSALDAHLDYHNGHGTRVAQYANRVGRSLKSMSHISCSEMSSRLSTTSRKATMNG